MCILEGQNAVLFFFCVGRGARRILKFWFFLWVFFFFCPVYGHESRVRSHQLWCAVHVRRTECYPYCGCTQRFFFCSCMDQNREFALKNCPEGLLIKIRPYDESSHSSPARRDLTEVRMPIPNPYNLEQYRTSVVRKKCSRWSWSPGGYRVVEVLGQKKIPMELVSMWIRLSR